MERRRFALRHFYVYPRLGIAYTFIPKNACTSFKRTFGQAQGWLDADASSTHDMRVSWWLSGLARYRSAAERIVVVRDPWDRLLSGFQNRFLMRDDEVAAHAMRTGLADVVGPDAQPADVTFEAFLKYLAQSPDRVLNEHWRPQSNFLVGSYTRVIRFEHLVEDTQFLTDRGIPLQSARGHGTSALRKDLGPGWGSRPARRLRRLRRREGVLPARASMYDERLTAVVAERFAEDVELWRAHRA